MGERNKEERMKIARSLDTVHTHNFKETKRYLVDPYQFLSNLKNKIKKWKLAFIATVLIGILVHIFAITNILPNHDGINNIFATQDNVRLGRWFLKYACGISSYYTLPSLISIISIGILGIVSALLVELFQVKKKLNIILLSAIVVTYPTIASAFSYMFTADGYMIALLLATISVLLANKYKYGFLIGSFCVCLSLGIYQAYISVTIILCILQILDKLTTKATTKEIMLQIGKYIAMGVIGFVSYYIILEIVLHVRNLELSSYQGINSLSNLSIENFLQGVKQVYNDFISFIYQTRFHKNNILVLVSNIIVVFILVYLYIKKYRYQRSYKKIVNNILLIVLILVVPIGLNIISLLSAETEYHLLMRYAWCLCYIYCIVLLDKANIKSNIIKWLGILATLCIIGNYIIVDNIAYFNLYYKFQKSYSIAFKLSERIENYEGYNQNMPIAIIGRPDKGKYPSTNVADKIIQNITGANGNLMASDSKQYQSIFSNYLNMKITIASNESIEAIQETEEFQNMPTYPEEESIAVINEVLVIKLSN